MSLHNIMDSHETILGLKIWIWNSGAPSWLVSILFQKEHSTSRYGYPYFEITRALLRLVRTMNLLCH